MKKIMAVTLFAFLSTAVYAGGELKEVCTDRVDKAGKPVLDKKTGEPIKDCKKIRVHKKVEGEKVAQ